MNGNVNIYYETAKFSESTERRTAQGRRVCSSLHVLLPLTAKSMEKVIYLENVNSQ